MSARWLSRAAPLLALAVAAISVGLRADADPVAAGVGTGNPIVAMRRLTEAQYRNSVADIFGSDIRVAGRFEPIVRPGHELIASGASDSSISPSGLEQFDAIGRGIAAQVCDAAHRPQLQPCTPTSETAADAVCAAQTLAPIGHLLFRRPLSQNEQQFYVGLASQAATSTASFGKGLELALEPMLISPHFLSVVERAEPDPTRPGGLRLDSASRAARLSFVLWNSTPNAALLRAAEQGRLTRQADLERTAMQMVASPRFESGVRAFFSDMLLFEKFDELAKDRVIYPYFNQDVAAAMPEQTLRTITGHLLTDDGDYRALFTTKKTWMNRALGSLYQVPVRSQHGWEPYEFPSDSDRAGLLGQAGFLAIYSHSGRSSPTIRGRAVREVLMCQPVPNPPGNVNFTAVQDTANRAMPTARIRRGEHISNPVCAGCHRITDPIGLSLERFDGIGAPRQTENGAPIDVAGAIGRNQFEGATGLGRTLAESSDTPMCLASRAMEYAAGRPSENEADVASVLTDFGNSGYRIRALFLNVVTRPEAYRLPGQPAPAVALRQR